MLATHRLHEYTKGRTTYLTTEAPRSLPEIQKALLDTLATTTPCPESKLKGTLSTREQGRFIEAVDGLLKGKGIFPRTVGRAKWFTITPPAPCSFLSAAQKTALGKILKTVNDHRQPLLSLESLLAILDGSEVPANKTALDADLSEDMLVRWHTEDLSRAGRPTIPIPWTLEHYQSWCEKRGVRPDLDLFHDTLAAMARSRRIMLSPHEYPSSLPSDEAALMRRDPNGRLLYYWTIQS